MELVGRDGLPEMFFDSSLLHFTAEGNGSAGIRIEVDTRTPFPAVDNAQQLFTATPGGLWTVYDDQARDRFLITLHDVASEPAPYKVVTADREFRNFHLFSRPREGRLFAPLEYPLDELVVSGHVNINNIGILLHSAAVLYREETLLFAGVSGAGKSTLSEIWQQVDEVDVITDERVILREKEEAPWAFGTPWHGTAGIHQNRGAPVRAIYFISHGHRNRAKRLSARDAANQLMVRCFPTFWHREGMASALACCIGVAGKIPCYTLEFVPDISVTGYVREHAGQLPG